MDMLDLDALKAALNERKGRWPRICRQAGLDYSWLQKFAQGRIKNPGYAKVMALYRCLYPEGNAAA